jgi:hypothetical protein
MNDDIMNELVTEAELAGIGEPELPPCRVNPVLTPADQAKFCGCLEEALKAAEYFAKKLRSSNSRNAILSRLHFALQHVALRFEQLKSVTWEDINAMEGKPPCR